jgi:hypothetical protein
VDHLVLKEAASLVVVGAAKDHDPIESTVSSRSARNYLIAAGHVLDTADP